MAKKYSVGRQWLVDIHDYPDIPKEKSLDALKGAAEAMGSQIVTSFDYESESERVAYLLIGESHMSLHHYPKIERALLDMFICGDKDLQKGFDYLRGEIGFKEYDRPKKFIRKWSPLPMDSGEIR